MFKPPIVSCVLVFVSLGVSEGKGTCIELQEVQELEAQVLALYV